MSKVLALPVLFCAFIDFLLWVVTDRNITDFTAIWWLLAATLLALAILFDLSPQESQETSDHDPEDPNNPSFVWQKKPKWRLKPDGKGTYTLYELSPTTGVYWCRELEVRDEDHAQELIHQYERPVIDIGETA
jgi:hypothetical protein